MSRLHRNHLAEFNMRRWRFTDTYTDWFAYGKLSADYYAIDQYDDRTGRFGFVQ